MFECDLHAFVSHLADAPGKSHVRNYIIRKAAKHFKQTPKKIRRGRQTRRSCCRKKQTFTVE
jgi:hypothetical protein